jgi:peptide/nickel transport system substrate-binding protein
MSEIVPSDGTYAYGGYPDIDALYRQQARETDRKKREALLSQIQQPRVAEPALMLINPHPWSAPLEEVRLKK